DLPRRQRPRRPGPVHREGRRVHEACRRRRLRPARPRGPALPRPGARRENLRRQEAKGADDAAGGDQRDPRPSRQGGQDRRAPQGRRPVRLRPGRRGGAGPPGSRPPVRGSPRGDERDSGPRLRRHPRDAPPRLDVRGVRHRPRGPGKGHGGRGLEGHRGRRRDARPVHGHRPPPRDLQTSRLRRTPPRDPRGLRPMGYPPRAADRHRHPGDHRRQDRRGETKGPRHHRDRGRRSPPRGRPRLVREAPALREENRRYARPGAGRRAEPRARSLGRRGPGVPDDTDNAPHGLRPARRCDRRPRLLRLDRLYERERRGGVRGAPGPPWARPARHTARGEARRHRPRDRRCPARHWPPGRRGTGGVPGRGAAGSPAPWLPGRGEGPDPAREGRAGDPAGEAAGGRVGGRSAAGLRDGALGGGEGRGAGGAPRRRRGLRDLYGLLDGRELRRGVRRRGGEPPVAHEGGVHRPDHGGDRPRARHPGRRGGHGVHYPRARGRGRRPLRRTAPGGCGAREKGWL
ncbi:MAG: Uroporphyrinogen-III methyltransferase / Uroporphyrinogen-III synthase, partial [uncultured Rubrobacteraceae bacterium]